MNGLLRNFTVTATIAFALAAVVSYVVHQRLRLDQNLGIGEDRNVALVKVLSNSLGQVYEELLDPRYSGDESRRLRNLRLLAQETKEHTADV